MAVPNIAADAVITTRPAGASTRCPHAAPVTAIDPCRVTSIVRRQVSADSGPIGAPAPMPALFTTMSTPPKAATAVSITPAPSLDDVVGIGDGLPTGSDDLGDDRVGFRYVVPVRKAHVVDHDPTAPLGQHERVGPTETAAGPGDHGDLTVEAERLRAGAVSHAPCHPRPSGTRRSRRRTHRWPGTAPGR